MVLNEYACPHCGEPPIDSFNYCHHCKHAFTGTLAKIVHAHHTAKLMLVGRCLGQAELDRCHDRLLSASQGFVLAEKIGMPVSAVLIDEAFREILYE